MTATMQTAAPLTELRTTTANRPVTFFEMLIEDGRADVGRSYLDMEPPYQRGDVWGLERRRELIRSLIIGVPIGAIVINDRAAAGFQHYGTDHTQPSRDWAYSVIDGQQRLTTLLMWMAGDLAVPASWFDPGEVVTTEDTPDGPYVRLTGLQPRQARFWSNKPLAVIEARVATLAAERVVFELINFGGVPQGESDL